MYLDELKTDIGDPLSEEGFAVLKEEAETQIASGYLADQTDLVNYISQLLVDKGVQLSATNPKRFDELQRYWALLAFAAFIGYSAPDKDNLLQRRILYAIQKGLDPESVLKQFYSLYQSDEFIQEAFRVFAHDLEQNTETFGTMPITVEGRRMLPQLKYWILDYAKFPSKSAKRGTVERLNYVNNSPNAKGLTQGQRETLLAVLKLYDEFLNPNIPQRENDLSFENELTDTYAETVQENPVPASAAIPVQVPASTATLSPIHENSDQELIADKLENLRERSQDIGKGG